MVIWILVCDAALARLFEKRRSEPSWRLVQESTHAESRSRVGDLVSDHSGQSSSEGGSVHRNALAPSSDPKEVEKCHFVHSLVATLDKGMRSRHFDRWVLVAPPHVMGMVKKELTTELAKHLMATVGKDLKHLTARELAEQLRDVVRAPLQLP